MRIFILCMSVFMFWSLGCVPAAIVGGAYHSSKTKEQRQDFMADFHKTNEERIKNKQAPLDWCSEAYRMDKKYAKTDPNCAARVKAYEAGDTAALANASIVADPNDKGDPRKSSTHTR